MRGIVFAVGLILTLASRVAAFEIEEQQDFGPADGAEVLSILSTTDTAVFAPLIDAFRLRNPAVTVRYTVASTQEVYRAVHDDRAPFDLVVSSAMDLQLKLANDGFAASHRSSDTARLPVWARWRDQVFAFAQEPVVLIVSEAAFAHRPVPRTRSDIVALLRAEPEAFRGRIGTYDPTRSGAGYLFATQDARQSDTVWRLAEVMGGLDPQLYETSGAMIADLQAGRIDMVYNALGSYAAATLPQGGDARIVELEDFTHVLLRTALIPEGALAPDLGAAFLDFLLSEEGQRRVEADTGLPRISSDALADGPHLRPIRLDPGLLVFVDPLMRQRFLREWQAALVQP